MADVAERETIRATQILLLLAKEGPLNKYHIWKGVAKHELGTEPTILTTIKRLEYVRCIEVRRIEKNPRGPKPSKYYDLTLRGLTELVARLDRLKLKPPDVNSLHRHLAEKYRDLIPDVFAIWPEMVEAGIEDLAQKRLRLFSIRFIREEQRMYGKPERLPPVMPPPPALTKINAWFFLSPDPFSVFADDQSDTRWLNAIGNSPTLRETFMKACCDSLRWSLRDFKSRIDVMVDVPWEKDSQLEAVRQKCLDLITSVELLAQLEPPRDYTNEQTSEPSTSS